MFKLIAILIFALVTSMPAQATPVAPVHEPDSIITQAAAACGPGMTRVNGVCVSRHHKRQARNACGGMAALRCLGVVLDCDPR